MITVEVILPEPLLLINSDVKKVYIELGIIFQLRSKQLEISRLFISSNLIELFMIYLILILFLFLNIFYISFNNLIY